MRLLKYSILFCLSWVACTSPSLKQNERGLPQGFVYLKDIDPTIAQEMRYAGHYNFMGRPVNDYLAAECILTEKSARRLAAVQADLAQFSLSLKVYDCYRPQKAVDHFVSWGKDLKDLKMRKEFYPQVKKEDLFGHGDPYGNDAYIAEKSGHSRGSTMDLTIIPLSATKPSSPKHLSPFKGTQPKSSFEECSPSVAKRFPDNSLDFGTGFDCFDPLANTLNPLVGQTQKQNRALLKAVMEKNGFKNYPYEWWHYTLVNEPFQDTYFTFSVK